MPGFRTCSLLLLLNNPIWLELNRDKTMKDEESLNPDNTFCQAQVDVQKMIDQLKEQSESPEDDE
ncbi:MAG: hypothetical protein ACR2NF_09575 [Pirellulales bacterium]